jgi:hypothetical protein
MTKVIFPPLFSAHLLFMIVRMPPDVDNIEGDLESGLFLSVGLLGCHVDILMKFIFAD